MDSIASAICGMDVWLDTMRTDRGYCGPVAHRWEDCLIYSGPGFDWRYEGIISGYLQLHELTGDQQWLRKACRAGEDLLSAQLENGCYPVSSFELNPAPGGTPHEAACDLILLNLAAYQKENGIPHWEGALSAARRNLVNYQIGRLWDPDRHSFCDLPGVSVLVPNKICTLAEAGFALARLEAQDDLLEQYFLPAMATVLSAQVKQKGSHLHGAIDQSMAGLHPTGRFFPYYTARCIPALLEVYRYTGELCYLDAAVEAMDFVFRCQRSDGSFPQVLYSNGRQTAHPRWIAGCGDILRAARLLEPYGFSPAGLDQAEAWLLGGIMPSGGIRTASGFAALESFGQQAKLPDFRDLLSVCGWVDKAFRYLTGCILPGTPLPSSKEIKPVSQPCLFRGREAIFFESDTLLQVSRDGKVLYQWQKGESWAHII